MSKAWRLMVAAACVAAVALSSAPAPSATECDFETTWRYCGDHVPASELPLRFSYSNSGSPVGDIRSSINAAMTTWNEAWPGAKVGCSPLCLSSGGSNTISWGSPASCPNTSANAIAVACLTLGGPGSDQIDRVEIILNSSKAWQVANSAENVAGELRGVFWGNLLEEGWYDVQSVVTHELGHALGLEDIGNPQRKWPYDLTDAGKYTQTMYNWYYTGTTSKRTLESGDIAGLQRAAAASFAD